MGFKMGVNGVDNAKLSFDNVRVPRENLLNKFSDVAEDGTFSSGIKSNRGRFLTVADQLLSGRLIHHYGGVLKHQLKVFYLMFRIMLLLINKGKLRQIISSCNFA